MESLQRPTRWRKPKPHWLYPYGFLLSACFYMTSSQNPDLFLKVVCVAHPPEKTNGTEVHQFGTGSLEPFSSFINSPYGTTDWNLTTSVVTSPFEDIDPKACRHDIEVQKSTAHIQLLSSLVSGVLGVAVTGFWSSLSDRVGRTRVLAISQTGIALADLAFLIIASWPRIVLTTGLGVLLIGPVLMSITGGNPVLGAVVQAYLADTAKSMLVARLSLFLGVIAGGAMVGPLVGSWLVDASGDILLPYKIAVPIQGALALFLLFVLPESLSPEVKEQNIQKAMAAREAADNALDNAEAVLDNVFPVLKDARIRRPLQRCIRAVLALFEPLAIFIPRRDPNLPGRGRNYNLFLMGVASFVLGMTKSVNAIMTQYAMYVFGWGQEQLSPYFSMVGFCRTVVLVGLVPLITRFLEPLFAKREAAAAEEAESPTERTPLLRGDSESASDDEEEPESEQVTPKRKGSSAYNRFIVLSCLIIAFIGFFALGVNSGSSEILFIGGTAWLSLAQPATSASGALSLELADAREPGRVFGALGIIDALSSTFLSSLLYTFVYTQTIGTYPPAVFLVAAASFALAAAAVAGIRLPKVTRDNA